MGIFSSIFGGGPTSASKESQAATLRENRAIQDFIERQTGQAREDVTGLFPGAADFRSQGFQGAIDLLGRGVPAELQAFQAGNVGAQRVTADTLDKFRSAILGLPATGFDPIAFDTDTSFLRGLQVPSIQDDSALPNAGLVQPPATPPPGGFSRFGRGLGSDIFSNRRMRF